MSVKILPKINLSGLTPIEKGGIQKQLETKGKLPPVVLQVTPIDGSKKYTIDKFMGYKFTSNMLIPVDTFSFSFVAPDETRAVNEYLNSGDLVTLYGNDQALATGMIDQVEVSIDSGFGEIVNITGRDLLSQLEDQDAVSLTSDPIFLNKAPLTTVLKKLFTDTRIQGYQLQRVSNAPAFFGTEAGESKLGSLQRHLESLNALIWMTPTGEAIVGKPDFSQKKSGDLYLLKSQRRSNVFTMSAVRAENTIPNVVVPIYAGQELVTSKIGKRQALRNNAAGPKRLYRAGYRLPKSIVVSIPGGGSVQDAAEINKLIEAGQSVGAGNQLIVDAYAKRMIARENQKELVVQCVVPGHYNESAEPYYADTIYNIQFDRAGIDKDMYCYAVEYDLTEEGGQRTTLMFCNPNTIVADAKVRGT